MDQFTKYIVFAVCCITGAVVLFCLHLRGEWKLSRQKEQEEYIKFWHHMEKLGVDPKIIAVVARDIRNMGCLEKENKRLDKINKQKKMQGDEA